MSEIEQRGPTLIMSRPGDAAIAADLKKRFEHIMAPALDIMDEAARAGMAIHFDGIAMTSPIFRHRIMNLRVIKQY